RRLSAAPLIETPDRGRYGPVRRARLGSGPGQPLDAEQAEPLRQHHQLQEQLRRLEAQGTAPPAEMQRRLETLAGQLEREGAGRNLIEVEDRPLGKELDGEAAISQHIERFKAARLASAREVVREAPPEGPVYATSGGCVRCHSEQLARWTFTGHAQATATLIRRGLEADTECIACHTTGFGQAGGFAELDRATLRTYGGVQCEACHGPLGGHPSADVTPQPVSEQTCLRCHDAANSPNFDYETYLPAVICPSMPPATLNLP
ncbi:MAG: cytochrome c family protein, partial [Alphaproteobacteria bacterium]|nr:cytochrome c family protein [Alphaproteobacteria bacterium]